MKTLVRIELEIPLTIFEEPSIKIKSYHLFDSMKEAIQKRIHNLMESTLEVPYDSINTLFKANFYQLVLNKAVQITLTEEGKYDMLTNIKSLLTAENLRNAIMGKTMIDAFCMALNSLPPSDSAHEMTIRGSKFFLLQNGYIE